MSEELLLFAGSASRKLGAAIADYLDCPLGASETLRFSEGNLFVRVLENVKAVLAQAGLDLAHVVKTTVFLKSMADFAAMNEVYARYLVPQGVVAPARSTIAVAGLPKDALVEIEVIVKVPSKT